MLFYEFCSFDAIKIQRSELSMLDLSEILSGSEFNLNKTLSVPELRFYIGQLNEKTHPNVVFFFLCQCRMQRKINGCWPDVKRSELHMLNIYYVTQRRQAQIEAVQNLSNILEDILAKNQNTPLNFEDAVELSQVMEDINQHQISWRALPVTKIALCKIIELAACGYTHRTQVA